MTLIQSVCLSCEKLKERGWEDSSVGNSVYKQ